MSPDYFELSRRQVLAGIGAGGALLLAGCSSAVADKEGSPKKSAKPRSGGVLNAGIATDLIPGNFFTNSNHGVRTTIGLAFDRLINYPNDQVVPKPSLATAWELAADGKSLALDLRDDVTFHNGRPFTSEDVAFSIQTYADPVWNGQLKSTAAAVTKVDTSDKHRAVLHLAHPLGNIFDLLDTIPIVDHETIDDLGTGKKIIGTGPFTLKSWTPSTELVFEKNEKYWKPGRPYLDGVRATVVPQATSLTSQLRSGQIDLADGASYRDVETLVKSGGYEAITLEGAETQIYVGTNVTAKPLDDVRIRQAIAFALDRDRVISEVYRGVGYPVNLPWPKYSPAYDAEANQTYGLDVSKAKALVKEVVSEVGSLPTLPLTYGTGSPVVEASAQIVQANLKEIGINVELDPIDQAQFVKTLIGAKFEGIWVTIHSWAQYTPSTLTVSAYPFNAAKNASRYDSADYRKDADAAWTIADGTSAEAKAAYGRVSQDLLDALFLIEIGIVFPQYVTSNQLRDVSYTKRMELDLTNAYLV